MQEIQYQISALTIPAAVIFHAYAREASPETIRQAEQLEAEQERQKREWMDIISNPALRSLQFTGGGKYPITYILHPSTRLGIDWQLSRIGYDGIPNGHGDYYKDRLQDLCDELCGYTARSGAAVAVILDEMSIA